ncbi:hypothetical protein D7V97_08015 [Corallococcus sp. CA053C]|nr:hypothetical protein D7V97_08015 [Corallococcus sp. CA053C]
MLRDTARDLERRVSDPAWRTMGGPRSHLFDPCPVHPPEVALLSTPGAIEAEAGFSGLAPTPHTGLAEADGASQPTTIAGQEEADRQRAKARTAVLPRGSTEELADTAARLAEDRARTDGTPSASTADAGLGGSTAPLHGELDTTVDIPGAGSEETTPEPLPVPAGTAPGGMDEAARIDSARSTLSGRGDVRITIRPATGGPGGPTTAAKPPPLQTDASVGEGGTDAPPRADPTAAAATEATKQLADAHAQGVQGIQQGLESPPDTTGVIPAEATTPATVPAPPPTAPVAEAPAVISPAAPAGPQTDVDAVTAWKGRIASTTEKVPEPKLPPAPRYTFKIQQAAVDPNAVRAARLKQLEDEGKRAITPAKRPEDLPAIPDDPTGKASALVDSKCDRKLEVRNAKLPDLQKSPLGHVPEIGAQLMRDDGGHLLIKGPLGDLVYKPGGPKPTDPEKLKDWTRLQKKITDAAEKQKKAKAQPKEPAKGITVLEEAAPAPINVPDFARVDIGDVLARLLAAPDTYADASVKKAREAYVPGGLDASWGVALLAAERPIFAAELQRVADAAKIKKEDLDAKVEARRKQLVDSHQATTETLSKAHEEAKTSIVESGKTFGDALSRVRASLDAQAEARAAAIQGGVDLTEARRKRDALLAAVDTKVGNWIVRYDQNGKRFKEAFGKAASDQMRAYELAALQDEWQLKKDAGDDPVKLKAATEKYRPTKKWLDDRRKELGAVVGQAKRDIDANVERYQEELRRAGKDAKEAIRDWHAKQIGYERGFWDRLISWIIDWLDTAHDESKAWEAARAEENKTSLDKNMLFLAEVRLRQGEELDVEALKQRQDLGEEQKAILLSYYGKNGKDAVQALAEGLAVRISGQRRKPLMEALEKEILASDSLDRVRTVVEAQKPQFSFDALNIVGKVEQGVNYTWGTDEQKIFDALANLTPIQGHYVELLYASRNDGENLRERLKSELDDFFSTSTHDWDRAEALLSGNAAKAAAVELDDAMEGTFFGTGWGTDESAILTLLRGKTPEQIDAIKKAYKEKYGRDLVEKMDDELRSGSFHTHDADEMHALVEGRTEDARAIELDRAMRGSWFFGLGTDRKGIEAVYERVRKETEADAQQYGWDTKTFREELLKRNRGLDASYEKQYGKDWTERAAGESALSAAYRDEMGGDELKLIEGLRDDKGLQVDAARIHIEHTSFFYADDKIIRDAMSAEGRRQIADERRDGYLDIQERIDIERGLDEAKVKPASAGPLTDADRKKGLISELEFLEKWSPEKVRARLTQERKAVDVAAKAHAQAHAQANMQALGAEYDATYAASGQMSFVQAVLMDTSGADRDAVAALLDKGYLTDAEVVQYAVQGVGTDEDALKEVLAGKSREEINAIAEEWAKNNPPSAGDTRTPFERFRARIEEELSGREAFDILDMVDYGEAVTPREKLERARRREGFEARSSNMFSRSTRAILGAQTSTLDDEVRALELHEAKRPKPGDKDYNADTLRAWQEGWEKKADRVEHQAELADEAVKMHREQVDTITDFFVTIASAVVMAVAVVIGVVLSVFFPPAGVGFWAALGAFMASSTVVVGTAVAIAAVTMITKAALKGAAYGWEEAATDAGVGAVDALTSLATAGMGSKLLRMGFLARMAGEGGVFARMTAHGLAQGAEGLVQSVPSAFLGNVLNDENYKGGNALLNVLAGTAMQAAPGTLLSGGLGALGGISKPRPPPPRTGDLLAFRGTPQERLTLYRKWKVENPAGGMKDFLREFDDSLLKQVTGDFEKKQLQRVLRKEMLTHIPPAQRAAFANTPIELVSEADFRALTGSDAGQAVTMFRRGKPTIVVKAGADLADLGEEGLHLLQRHDKATRDLVRSLDETALRHWDKLPVEKQFELYRKKLRLEIDAQESLIASLEAKRGVSMDPGEAARRIEQGERSLEALRKRLGEVDAFTPLQLAEFGQGVRPKPQYLREPPRLFSKKPPKTAAAKVAGGKKPAAPGVTDTPPVVREPGRPVDAWPNTTQHAAHPEVGPFSKSGPLDQDAFIASAERQVFTPAQRGRTTLKLAPGDTVAQVGPAWAEIKPGTTERRFYKLVEVTRADGRKEYLQLIMSKRPGQRWEVRGSMTRGRGDVLEHTTSQRMTEALLGEEFGVTKRYRRLDFKPMGVEQGSGFDEIIVEFDDAATPGSARLHLVEVKGGETAPVFKKFTAVSENLQKNLDGLRAKLGDASWRAAHGLGPTHVAAITQALDEWNLRIELRMGPTTPVHLLQSDLVSRIERVADAWRKLSVLDAVVPASNRSPFRRQLVTLGEDLKAALHTGHVAEAMKALDAVEQALNGTGGKPGLLARYHIDTSKMGPLVQGLGPHAKPGQVTQIPKSFAAAQRVRTPAPGGGVLGWGGFDITLSQSWASRRFKRFELAQMHGLRRSLLDIPELDPATFSTLSLRDRQRAIAGAVDASMEALGIPKSRRARVQFQNLAAGDYGWMDWRFGQTPQGRLVPLNKRGVVVINENLDVGDAVGTAIHESRHYYQAYQAYQESLGRQSHPFSRRWRRNLPGAGGTYYGPADPRYFRQPIEADAESFGRRVIDLLPPQWPPP